MSIERPDWRVPAERYWYRLRERYAKISRYEQPRARLYWVFDHERYVTHLREYAGADKLDGWSPDLQARADTTAEQAEIREDREWYCEAIDP